MNDILAILSGGDYVSGEKISQELGNALPHLSLIHI